MNGVIFYWMFPVGLLLLCFRNMLLGKYGKYFDARNLRPRTKFFLTENSVDLTAITNLS
jgi:hypothetical protein